MLLSDNYIEKISNTFASKWTKSNLMRILSDYFFENEDNILSSFNPSEYGNSPKELLINVLSCFTNEQREIVELLFKESGNPKEAVFLKGRLKENYGYFNDIESDIKKGQIKAMKSQINTQHNQTSSLIFLSHKSEDSKYGDALAKLIRSLGVAENDLIYTSHPLHKIPFGNDIYDYLRDKLGTSVYMIFLLSDEYFESAACLCELGATWLAQSDYDLMFTPNFNSRNLKYIQSPLDKNRIGVVLKSDNSQLKSALIEFKNKILKKFSLKINEQKWQYVLEEFIKDIT